MRQTPANDIANADVLRLMPRDARRVIEIGCACGALAREYRKVNPQCQYIGLEIEPTYAAMARAFCSEVIVANIENIADDVFASLFPADCWIFADVLEHLYDPWSVLGRIRRSLRPEACVIACIPNMQHWTVQIRLNSGELNYVDAGLLDRTHIRWFTKKTMIELFETAGFTIVEGGARILNGDQGYRDKAMIGIRAMAEAAGIDPEIAVEQANAFQWIVRAIPAL